MPKISVELVGIDIPSTGKKFEIELLEQESTVRRLLEDLEDRFGMKLRLTSVYINDTGISLLHGLETRLREKDEVLITPIVVGG